MTAWKKVWIRGTTASVASSTIPTSTTPPEATSAARATPRTSPKRQTPQAMPTKKPASRRGGGGGGGGGGAGGAAARRRRRAGGRAGALRPHVRRRGPSRLGGVWAVKLAWVALRRPAKAPKGGKRATGNEGGAGKRRASDYGQRSIANARNALHSSLLDSHRQPRGRSILRLLSGSADTR